MQPTRLASPNYRKHTKQGRRELNSQPLVLETSALPIELRPCGKKFPLVSRLDASWPLLDDLGHDAGTDRSATFADGEPHAVVHGDRLVEFHRNPHVVTGHAHLGFN